MDRHRAGAGRDRVSRWPRRRLRRTCGRRCPCGNETAWRGLRDDRAETCLSVREMAPDERPRERLDRCGPQALSDDDLLAIVVSSGIVGETRPTRRSRCWPSTGACASRSGWRSASRRGCAGWATPRRSSPRRRSSPAAASQTSTAWSTPGSRLDCAHPSTSVAMANPRWTGKKTGNSRPWRLSPPRQNPGRPARTAPAVPGRAGRRAAPAGR